MFFGFSGLRVGNRLHAQFFPGRQTILRQLCFLCSPFRLPSCMGKLFILCLRWQFIRSKFQLGCFRRFAIHTLFLLCCLFLRLCRFLKTLLIFVPMLMCPVTMFLTGSVCAARWGCSFGRRCILSGIMVCHILCYKRTPGNLLPEIASPVFLYRGLYPGSLRRLKVIRKNIQSGCISLALFQQGRRCFR